MLGLQQQGQCITTVNGQGIGKNSWGEHILTSKMAAALSAFGFKSLGKRLGDDEGQHDGGVSIHLQHSLTSGKNTFLRPIQVLARKAICAFHTVSSLNVPLLLVIHTLSS